MVSDSSENEVADPLARARRPHSGRRGAKPTPSRAKSVAAGIALVALVAPATAVRADEGGTSAATSPVDPPAAQAAGSTPAAEAGSAPAPAAAPTRPPPTWEIGR